MWRAEHGRWGLLAAALLTAPAAHAAEPEAPRSELTPARRVDGQPLDAVIEIERAPGSDACPDAASVFRAIQRLFPEHAFRQSTAASPSVASARITIRPLPPGYEAVVTVLQPRRGERVILEKAEDCRGLADALALAFVMLVEPPQSEVPADAEDVSAPRATTVPPAEAAPAEEAKKSGAPAPEADRAEAPGPAGKRSFHADFGAAAMGGVGLLSEPALGASGGVDLVHESGWGASLQGMRLSSPPAKAEGGSVTLTLWGISLGPCYRGQLGTKSSLDGCVRFGAGAQHAEVEGFLQSESGSFPWMVIVPTLGYRVSLVEPLSGFVRVGPVVQVWPQSFSVRLSDGSGGVARVAAAPNVGAMAELGLAFGGKVF